VNWGLPPVVTADQVILGNLSNETEENTKWWRIFLHANSIVNEKLFASITYDKSACEFQIFLVALEPDPSKWMFTYFFGNLSLPGFDHYYNHDHVIATSTYDGYYYIKARAANGSGPFSISMHAEEVPSDGNNNPGSATHQEFEAPGVSKSSGNLDMFDNRFDWYKIHLERYEHLTIRMFFEISLLYGIYGITVYDLNENGELVEKRSIGNNDAGQFPNKFEINISGKDSEMDVLVNVHSVCPIITPSSTAQPSYNNSMASYKISFSKSVPRMPDQSVSPDNLDGKQLILVTR
jgi:hypothetical protein